LKESFYRFSNYFYSPNLISSIMKEQMKALLHENTYATDDSGKVIPINPEYVTMKAAMDLLNQKLADGFNDPEEEESFHRAALPLYISMSAFMLLKGEERHPHWVLVDHRVPVGQNALHWTGTKAEAVELIYELVKVGVLNNGSASIMQVTRWFELEFQIELVNVPKIFQDIRNRRKETTSLALKMDKALRQYIEQLDDQEMERNHNMRRA
jgi:RteC protein